MRHHDYDDCDRCNGSSIDKQSVSVRPPVAFVVSRFPVVTETFILREIQELERQGQSVLLVPLLKEQAGIIHVEAQSWIARALYTPFLDAAITRANLKTFFSKPGLYIRLLFRLVASTLSSPNFLLRTLLLFPKSVYLARRLEQEGIRHIHAHFATHPATVAYLVSRLSPISFSFTVHAHDIFVRRQLLDEKLHYASFIRAISRFNRRYLEEHYGSEIRGKTHVIHMGLNTARYGHDDDRHAVHEAEAPTVLCVAALKPYKGIPVLLQACRRLRDAGFRFRCDLIGEGPLHDEIENQIKRFELQNVVRLLGPCPEDEVALRLKSASVFVLPSVIARDGQMEGIPVALMEAMASSCPVIAPSLSGIPELVKDSYTGLLFEPGNATQLADQMQRLLSDDQLRSYLTRNAKKLVTTEFELKSTVNQLLDHLNRENPKITGDAALGISPALGACNINHQRISLERLNIRSDSQVAMLLIANGETSTRLVHKRHAVSAGATRPEVRAQHEFSVLQCINKHFPVKLQEGCRLAAPAALGCSGPDVLLTRCLGKQFDAYLRQYRFDDYGLRTELCPAFTSIGTWLKHLQQITLSATLLPASKARFEDLVLRAEHDLTALQNKKLGKRDIRCISALLKDTAHTEDQAALRTVTHHGDFWPGNVFIADAQIEVIDFEGTGIGTPYADAAYFLLHAELFFTFPFVIGRFPSLATAFFRGYEGSEQPVDSLGYQVCQAAIALHLLRRHFEDPDPSHRLSFRHRWLLIKRAKGQTPWHP